LTFTYGDPFTLGSSGTADGRPARDVAIRNMNIVIGGYQMAIFAGVRYTDGLVPHFGKNGGIENSVDYVVNDGESSDTSRLRYGCSYIQTKTSPPDPYNEWSHECNETFVNGKLNSTGSGKQNSTPHGK